MKHGADTVMDDYEKNVFRSDERERGSGPHTSPPALAFKRCCDSCINVPCKVLNRIPCLAQEKQENICEENGCTDIENCDEICQHSRLFSPLQMQEAKEQAAKAERERVLDKVIAFCKSNDCVQKTYGDMDCLSTTDTECVICFCGSLRGGEP